MKYLSVCSGIEAATVAWHPLGWEPAGFAEIEPFPAAVLAHHYPTVPNFGDMTKYKEWDLEPGTVDLLVGGTPCQSFSVAGLRKGLADPRGNLALVYCGILDHLRPQWFVWENVPGVLSSSGGRDFGSFLGALAELGYGFAYRVLDAQYFGVAQRRRRVFVVGHLGDWRPAAEVLFERESLRRDPAPSRKAWKEPAFGAGTCASDGGDLAPTVTSKWQKLSGGPAGSVSELGNSVIAKPLLAGGHANNPIDENLVSYGIPGNWIGRAPENGGNAVEPMHDVAPCLTKADRHGVAQPIVYDTTNITSPQNGSNPQPGDPCFTLAKGQHPPLCVTGEITHTLKAEGFDASEDGTGRGQPIVAAAFKYTMGAKARGIGYTEEQSPTFDTKPDSIAVMSQMAVRRLTPVECERLQGFPDNYTNIPWRKQPESPDGPRYKALGNSMAVPVMAWIGRRIAMYKIQQSRMVA